MADQGEGAQLCNTQLAIPSLPFVSQYGCCGINNYTNWLMYNTTWSREREPGSNAIAPHACCMKNVTNCNQEGANLYHQVSV